MAIQDWTAKKIIKHLSQPVFEVQILSLPRYMFWHLLAKHIVILQLHTIHRMDLVVLPCNSRPPRLQGLRPVRNSMIQWSWHLPDTTSEIGDQNIAQEATNTPSIVKMTREFYRILCTPSKILYICKHAALDHWSLKRCVSVRFPSIKKGRKLQNPKSFTM